MSTRLQINLWLALSWFGAFGPLWGIMPDRSVPFAEATAIACGLVALTLAVRDVADAVREAAAPKHITVSTIPRGGM